MLNPNGSLPTAHADGTPLNSAPEWTAQFENYWYWNDGARLLTFAETGRLRAQLVPPAPRADRPRGAATGPRDDDPNARAAGLISANLVYQSALWRAIRAQGGMCITRNCQFDAKVLVNGKAYCCFACHTASALARASAPTVSFAPAGAAAARAATRASANASHRTPASARTGTHDAGTRSGAIATCAHACTNASASCTNTDASANRGEVAVASSQSHHDTTATNRSASALHCALQCRRRRQCRGGGSCSDERKGFGGGLFTKIPGILAKK